MFLVSVELCNSFLVSYDLLVQLHLQGLQFQFTVRLALKLNIRTSIFWSNIHSLSYWTNWTTFRIVLGQSLLLPFPTELFAAAASVSLSMFVILVPVTETIQPAASWCDLKWTRIYIKSINLTTINKTDSKQSILHALSSSDICAFPSLFALRSSSSADCKLITWLSSWPFAADNSLYFL